MHLTCEKLYVVLGISYFSKLIYHHVFLKDARSFGGGGD
jgi:hypothetical protein